MNYRLRIIQDANRWNLFLSEFSLNIWFLSIELLSSDLFILAPLPFEWTNEIILKLSIPLKSNNIE